MAKFRDQEGVERGPDSFRVDPRRLQIDTGFNVRDLDAPTARDALDELKASIRAEGVQVALEIRQRGDELLIVSGHRRHKVVMELIDEGVELSTVPAMLEPKIISEADRVARLITLNAGEPLTALEKAEVVRRLLAYGWDRAKIAQRLGLKTAQSIANYEELSAAPEPVREAVRSGEIAPTTAVNMARAERVEGVSATETLTQARSEAKAQGKSKITGAAASRRSANPKAPTAMMRRRSEDTISVLVTILSQIAESGDGERDRKNARDCLLNLGFANNLDDAA